MTEPSPEQTATPPHRWISLFGICAAAGIVWLAFADLGVAIPRIADESDSNFSMLQWANNAFSLVVVRLTTPESRDPGASGHIDWPGLATIGPAVFALLYALTEGPSVGWGDPRIVALLAATIVLAVAWYLVERRARLPPVDLRLFGIRAYNGALTANLTMNLAYAGLSFLLVLWLQNVRGYSAVAAGSLMIPATVGSSWHSGRRRPRHQTGREAARDGRPGGGERRSDRPRLPRHRHPNCGDRRRTPRRRVRPGPGEHARGQRRRRGGPGRPGGDGRRCLQMPSMLGGSPSSPPWPGNSRRVRRQACSRIPGCPKRRSPVYGRRW
ncbi:hypothetical protein [Streptomyces radiopugnans]|uniref:hypothetical protein n=1 Tax=Streptomyces radiopugnans TaxID=403935 RepID=UPI003F1A95F4